MSERDPRVSELYREGSREEPAAALDARIRAQARLAVERPISKPTPWWKRLALPMGAAVVLVLAVAITRIMERERPELVDSPAGAPEPATREVAPVPAVPPSPASAPSQPAVTEGDRELSSPAAGRPAVPELRVDSAGGPKAQEPAAASSSAEFGVVGRGAAEAVRAPAPVGPQVGPAEAAKHRPEPAREAAPSSAGVAPAAPDAPQGQELSDRAAAREEPGAPDRGTAEAIRTPAAGAPRAVPPAEAERYRAEPARKAAPSAAGTAPVAPAAPRVPERTDGTAAGSPEEWVELIRAALREGRAQDAERMLAELRQRYPDFALPGDLR